MTKPYFQDEKAGLTLYHGDSYELMPEILAAQKIDLVITDPPYEVAAVGGGIAGKRRYLTHGIAGKLDQGFDETILDRFENWFCFCSRKQMRRLVDRADDRKDANWMLLTWTKSNPTPLTNNVYLPDTEYVVHSYRPGRLFGEYKDKSRNINCSVEKNGFEHPTVKPIMLMTRLLALGTKESDLVFDPFVGTGTTLRACKDLKRRCVAIELEERHCETAAQRLQQECLF